MESFEELRKKAKMSEDDFAAIQQPFDKKTGKRNPYFDKIYAKKMKDKERLANEHISKEQEMKIKSEWEKRYSEERRLHPKYL
jgi:hypothetical protein